MKRIILSGEIGAAVTAAQVRRDINGAGSGDIEILISSPGGSVSAGLEIYNIIRDRKRDYPNSRMIARGVGIAASMGSYLLVNEAFNRIVVEDNAVLMIHNPAATIQGDAEELRKTAGVLDRIGDILASAYSRRMRKSIFEVKAIMAREEWYTGQDILSAGLADEIATTGNAVNREQVIARAKAAYTATLPRIRADIAASAGRLDLSTPERSTDGVIRNEADLMAAVAEHRIKLGFDPPVIDNVNIPEEERVFRRQIDDDRRRLGLEPRYNV